MTLSHWIYLSEQFTKVELMLFGLAFVAASILLAEALINMTGWLAAIFRLAPIGIGFFGAQTAWNEDIMRLFPLFVLGAVCSAVAAIIPRDYWAWIPRSAVNIVPILLFVAIFAQFFVP